MSDNTDRLKLVLSTQTEGLSDLEAATKALRAYGRAERSVTKAVKEAGEAAKDLKNVRGSGAGSALTIVTGGGRGGSYAGGMPDVPGFPSAPRRTTYRPGYGNGSAVGYGNGSIGGGIGGQLIRSSVGGINVGGIDPAKILQANMTGGPLGMVLEAGTEVADEFKRVATAAREASNSFRQALILTRGNTKTAAQLDVLGKIGGANLGSDAASLKDRLLSNDPRAIFWAQQLGISRQPDIPGRPRDRGKDVLRAIERLRTMKASGRLSDSAESDALESLGIPDARLLVDVPDSEYKRARDLISLKQRINSPSRRREMDINTFDQNLNQEMKDVSDEVQGQKANRLRRPVDNFLYEERRKLTNPNVDWQKFNRYRQPGEDEVGSPDSNSDNGYQQGGILGPLPGWLMGLFGRKPQGKKGSMAVPSNPGAGNSEWNGPTIGYFSGGSESAKNGAGDSEMMMLVSVLLKLNGTLSSTYGGGPRAQDAIPANLTGRYLVQAANLHALQQGSL